MSTALSDESFRSSSSAASSLSVLSCWARERVPNEGPRLRFFLRLLGCVGILKPSNAIWQVRFFFLASNVNRFSCLLVDRIHILACHFTKFWDQCTKRTQCRGDQTSSRVGRFDFSVQDFVILELLFKFGERLKVEMVHGGFVVPRCAVLYTSRTSTAFNPASNRSQTSKDIAEFGCSFAFSRIS